MDEDIIILANMLYAEMQKKGVDITKEFHSLTIWLRGDEIDVECSAQDISVNGKFEGGMKN